MLLQFSCLPPIDIDIHTISVRSNYSVSQKILPHNVLNFIFMDWMFYSHIWHT